MVVGEARALSVEFVEIRGLDPRMPMTGKIAITLVIRDDEDDVGLLFRGEGRCREQAKSCDEVNECLFHVFS